MNLVRFQSDNGLLATSIDSLFVVTKTGKAKVLVMMRVRVLVYIVTIPTVQNKIDVMKKQLTALAHSTLDILQSGHELLREERMVAPH